MKDADIINYLKRILEKEIPNGKIIIKDDEFIVLYNVSTNLQWEDGKLTKITVIGKDQNNNVRTFEKTFTWDAEGYLTHVGEWVEV